MTALVVHQDEQVRRMAVKLLNQQGIGSAEAVSVAEARSLLAAAYYDIAVIHLNLPNGAGADLVAELGLSQPDTATILISGSTAEHVGEKALTEGVDDYLPQPFSAEQLSVAVTRALRRSLERVRSGQLQQELKEQPDVEQVLAEEVVDCLTRAGRFRDDETSEHVERVGRSCGLIGAELGMPAQECHTLRVASGLHDIGKIGVPDNVLRKPGKLDPSERDLIERHPEIGEEILAGSTDPVLDLAATIARTHHERPDGEGYPTGLAGGEIPLAGRITAVADVFDALTHDRVYRPALTVPDALEIMQKGDGTQFDSRILAAFHDALPGIQEVSGRYPDATSPRADPAHPEAPLRVLVVEDHAAMARGLSLILQREGMEIAGMAGTFPEAERLIARRDADVIILDADLDGENGLPLIPAAHARGARVLLYTGGTNETTGHEMWAPDGVASKVGGPTELLAAIRDVAGGGAPSDSRVQRPKPSKTLLTPREREITALLAQGHNGEDIATELFLSHHTVRTHVRNAMTRADAKTRSHLIALALAAGEVQLDPESAA